MESLQRSLIAMNQMFQTSMAQFQQQLQQATSSPTVESLSEQFTAFQLLILSTLNTVQTQMQFLAREVDRQDMRGRRKMILMHGIPEEKSENVASTITNIVVEKLSINDFSSDCISRAHRLGRLKESKPRPILVKFRDAAVRNKVWFAKSKLKGTGVTQAEFLTKYRHSIFMTARQRFGVRKCWTRDGIIHVMAPDGTHHQVESLEELENIPRVSATSASEEPAPSPSEQPADNPDKAVDNTGSTRPKRAAKK